MDPPAEIKTEPVLDIDGDGANATDYGHQSQSNINMDVIKTEPMDVVFTVAEVKNEPELLIEDTTDQAPDSETGYRGKRPRNEELWRKNVTKAKREKGEAYMSPYTNQLVQARSVRPEMCRTASCPFKCSKKFTPEEREANHKAFWALSTQSKQNFYCENVVRLKPERSNRCKAYSYWYMLNKGGEPTRVCKTFFCNTLDISQSSLSYHAKHIRNPETNMARTLQQGKHRKKFISDDMIEEVKSHIASFPRESMHNCLAERKSYFRRELKSIWQMYVLYVQATKQPVKYHTYVKIFNEQPNIGFFSSIKEGCLKCLAHERLAKKSAKTIADHARHLVQIQQALDEKERDLKAASEKNVAFICVDLENVFNLPDGNACAMFFTDKWSTYNVTAKSNKSKTVYNAVWHEGISGRSVEDIASALIMILKTFLNDFPYSEHLYIWSESCVLMRNSLLSISLSNFLRQPESRKVKSITQKYTVFGHSCIAELDSVNNALSKASKGTSICSHPTLIKIIRNLPRTAVHELKFLHMESDDFKGFDSVAAMFNFKSLPFGEVNFMAYTADTLSIDYKRAFDEPVTTFNLVAHKKFNHTAYKNIGHEVQPTLTKPQVDAGKVKDIVSIFDYIEPEDIEFYNSLGPFQQLYAIDEEKKIEVERKLSEKKRLMKVPKSKQEDEQKKQKKKNL